MSQQSQNLATMSEKVKELRDGIKTEATKDLKVKEDKRKKPADEKRLQILKEGRQKRAEMMRQAKEAKRKEKELQGIKNEYNKPNSLKNKLKIQSDKIDELNGMIKKLSELESTIVNKRETIKDTDNKKDEIIVPTEIKIEKQPEIVKEVEEIIEPVVEKKLLLENQEGQVIKQTQIGGLQKFKFTNVIQDTVKTYKPMMVRRRDDSRRIQN
jgi:hypothetical protein